MGEHWECTGSRHVWKIIIIVLRGMVGYDTEAEDEQECCAQFCSLALHKSDCPGDERMLKANVSPDHRIVCSGMACVFQEEGGAFLNHTKAPYGRLVALGKSPIVPRFLAWTFGILVAPFVMVGAKQCM